MTTDKSVSYGDFARSFNYEPNTVKKIYARCWFGSNRCDC